MGDDDSAVRIDGSSATRHSHNNLGQREERHDRGIQTRLQAERCLASGIIGVAWSGTGEATQLVGSPYGFPEDLPWDCVP